ncbi:MAG: elongation factor P [Bacteroidota bacterium]|jgi:elongation factor P|nr:elongation factor P [Bacteroidota bacterium]|tara:strand:+ start:1533 stop:2096 length:564 start_codon:yes stop_codon:yes gene_type:complete
MASTSDIKNGLCIEYNGNLYFVTEFQHVKPGKGPAFVRTKLKNVLTGKVIDNTFPSGHKIITARVEKRQHQFLYNDNSGYYFMDMSSYEQISLEKNQIDFPNYLIDGMEVEISIHTETGDVLGCELPPSIETEIIYTEPGVKGDTATNATKLAKIETGTEIQVPLFINEKDKIRVDIKQGKYIERVK